MMTFFKFASTLTLSLLDQLGLWAQGPTFTTPKTLGIYADQNYTYSSISPDVTGDVLDERTETYL